MNSIIDYDPDTDQPVWVLSGADHAHHFPVTRYEIEASPAAGIREIMRMTIEGANAATCPAPIIDGWKLFFVGVVGADKITWSYKWDMDPEDPYYSA